MDRLRVLKTGLFSIVLIGIAFIAIPFLGSLKPSQKAYADRLRVDVSHLNEGEVWISELPTLGEFSSGYEFKLLFFKGVGDELQVWRVLVKDGMVFMPDIHWWRPGYLCKNFGIFASEPEVLTCLDKEVPEWWQKHWRWNVSGKNIEQMVDDMEPARGGVEGKYFVYGKD
ncbi:hypothetical protein KFE80_05650 [bacterium SCSIO 12696]|nr:hypothetical protein KFE80_05650 [bacterium SCSIO 12696]